MDAEESPAVSVVMATKNAERYLAEALDSLSAQTFKDFEIVVVDADSTDSTRRIAESYPRVTVLPQNGTGFAHAWNVGIAAARSPLISFLDSDDIWSESKLSKQAKYLEDHPLSECVVGHVQFFLNDERSIPPGFKLSLLQGTHVAYMPGTSMIRRGVFDKLGMFEPQWQITNDIIWFAKLRNSGAPIGIIDEAVLRKRIHSNNFSYVFDGLTYRSELLQFLRESLRSRRQTN
jgi:glycosyltransferase involved in cell wall biosynthesis